jgi:hypothetical protein
MAVAPQGNRPFDKLGHGVEDGSVDPMTGAIEPAQAAEIVNRVVQDFQPQDHGAVSHPRQGPFCL